MFNDKQQQIIARINDATDAIGADETIAAFNSLHDACVESFGSECVGYDHTISCPRVDANGERFAEFWIAFDETTTSARVVMSLDSHVATVKVADCGGITTLGRVLVSEALWALEQGVAFGDVEALAQRVGYEG